MGHEYHDGQRGLQDRFDTRRLADRLDFVALPRIGDDEAAFIEARDMFFLATADADGQPQCSYKGGDPGFVRVPDPETVVFPVYDGNGMFLSTGNVTVNPKVGMLFVDLEGGSRLRVNGTCELVDDHPLAVLWPGALFVAVVHVTNAFANCRRYVHHYQLVERSTFVPSADHVAPVPDWKRHPLLDGALASGDPALDPANPDAPASPHFA